MPAILASAVVIAASLAATSGLDSTDGDCTAFLTGAWSGQGTMPMAGETFELDNTYAFNADGTFETVNRYRSGGEWTEQTISGTWSAVPDAQPHACLVTMESSGDGFTSSSTSTFVAIDAGTFESMGFAMLRIDE